jgi:hypothetical protein
MDVDANNQHLKPKPQSHKAKARAGKGGIGIFICKCGGLIKWKCSAYDNIQK